MLEVIIGLLVGATIGITGVGGGVITAPVLMLLLHMPPAESVGTALAFSATAKINALVIYLRRKQIDWRTLGYLLGGGIPGVAAGSLLMENYRKQSTMWVTGLVGVAVVIAAGFGLLRPRQATGKRADRLRGLPFVSLAIGTEVGFSSAGAGALGTVLLFRLTALSPAAVVGTDLAFGLALSAVGGGLHIAGGNWNSGVFWKLMAGGIAGAWGGSFLAGRLPAGVLRRAVLSGALAMGLVLIAKAFGSL